MAISDSQKVDYLWKKIGYSATKSDNVKAGFEEAIPSPLQIRGDKVMTDSGSIPATIPVANTSILTVYTTSLPYECAVDGTTATPNRTWKTTLTDWISPEFGSTYQVKVWVNLASSAGNASTAGTSLSAGGSGNSDEWFFDYQAGTLHFIGTNLPNGVSFTGKSVYVSGARYTGGFGVSAPGSSGSVGNLTISNVTISANSSAVSSSANIIFSTSGTGAVQFTGNNAIGLPVGNIANRPTTVNAGYLRFNTEYETIEVWDGTEWVQTSGGVITSDVLSGDGSTTQFALSANTTTTGVLVSINGTIQKPSTAYTVSNNVITFTEIPVLGDAIEVRKLAGGTISVNYGNSEVAAFLSTYAGLYSNVQTLTYLTSGVAGNIIPSANVTYSLGSPTRQWKDLFVSNNTIYIGGIPLSIDASGNLLVNGSQVQGSGGSSGTNYSNVNVAAYLSTNNYLTSTTANLSNYAYAANITTANVGIIGYIDRANTIQSNQISAANIGIIGYIDLANTIQSTQISAANLGMRGYVDNQITTIIGSAPGVLDTLGELANALGADANLSVTITSQIANVNANITTANLGMKGYVDNSVSTANIGVIGYIDLANTIQSQQISAANVGIKGYIDNSTSTANIGMKGYVDSVATLSSYSNVNVSALITTNGLTNYSNVNVIAYLAGNITVGNITTAGTVSTGNLNATNITVNGQPTTYGYVNGSYLFALNNADQSVGQNGNVNFQTTSLSNGGLITKTSNSQVTLTAGNTYKLRAVIGRLASNSTWAQFRWYDVTNSAYVGSEGFSEAVTSTSPGVGSTCVPIAYVSPSVNTTYELRQTTANTITINAYAAMEVEQLNPSIAVQATATGTVAATVIANTSPNSTTTTGGSSTSPALTVLTVAIPTAGTWRLDAELRVYVPAAGYMAAAFYDNGTLISGSEYFVAAGGVTQTGAATGQYGGFMSYNLTTTGARTVTLGFWSTTSSQFISSEDGRTWLQATRLDSIFALNTLATMSVTGNVSANYFVGNGALLTGIAASSTYSNVQVATYLPTYAGNIANIRLGVAGVLTFADSTTQTTAAVNNNFGNVNVSALITTNGLTNYSNVNVIAYLAGNITVGNIAGKTSGFTLGYLEMPQVASGNVTLALSDSGKHFYNTTASPQTITIPSFANVAFGNGTVVSIANQSTSNISVALQSGVILYLAGNTTSASRTITSYGIATLLKVNTNTWFINGSGVA